MTKNKTLGKCVVKHLKNSRNIQKGQWVDESKFIEAHDSSCKNLFSVIDENDLQKLMAKAVANDDEFLHKDEFKFINNDQPESSVKKVFLRIPRRPNWAKMMTSQEFHELESLKFIEWRRNLAKVHENLFNQKFKGEILSLTPYEKNLEVWRQLWLVIERSNVLVQIVDARNPLFYRNLDLEKYLLEMSSTFLSQTSSPSNNFDQNDIINENENYSNLVCSDSTLAHDVSCNNTFPLNDRSALFKHENYDKYKNSRINLLLINKSDLLSPEQIELWSKALPILSVETFFMAEYNQMIPLKIIKRSELKAVNEDPELQEKLSYECWNSNKTLVIFFSNLYDEENDNEVLTPTDFLELLNILKMNWSKGVKNVATNHYADNTQTSSMNVGFVGYPNVGKSSTINALLGAKKVSVSATPGKTKHFQTHLLPHDPSICLCDCPGLVMPNFVEGGKSELVVNGIVPIDTITDPFGPIDLVIKHVGVETFKKFYGLHAQHFANLDINENLELSRKYLAAHSKSRGFATTLAQADFHHSARIVLKDYINGRLLYCNPPPGIDSEYFASIGLLQTKNIGGKQRPTNYPENNVPNSVEKHLDAQFFKKAHDHALHHKLGINLVQSGENMPEGCGGDFTIKDLNPGKKHFNKNKHEKMRRLVK